MIPIYIPSIKKYTNSALRAINENWISNYGFNVQNAEKLLAKILGILCDSSFFCMAINLDIQHDNNYYVSNNCYDFLYENTNQKKFYRIGDLS